MLNSYMTALIITAEPNFLTESSIQFDGIWQVPLSRVTHNYLIYTSEQLRGLLKGPAVIGFELMTFQSVDWHFNH